MNINLAQVTIPQRLRTEPYGEDKMEALVESIKRYGLLQPIVVEDKSDGTYELKIGEHRLLAVTKLTARGDAIPGLPVGTINAEVKGKLSPMLSLMIEFEENERRKDFTWQEKAAYVRRLHDMLLVQNNGRWTGEMTAEALGIATGSVSYYLNLDKTIEEHPEVGKAATMSAAIKRAKVAKKIEVRKNEIIKDASPALRQAQSLLKLGKGEEWMASLEPNSVDLVNLDPPWGDDTANKVQENWEGFEDSTAYAQPLIEALLHQTFRVLKNDRWCIFWYRTWAYREMFDYATKKVGFNPLFSQTPCVWYKPDKVSDQMRFPEKQLIDSYENFLLLRKGDPVFYEREVQNVFVEPRVPRSDAIHPTEKPVPLMERLIKMTSVPGELVIDPTAGSGSALHAAYRVYRKIAGCELSQSYHDKIIIRLTEAMK